MNISIASLGNNEDPDSFINKFGKPALLEKLDKSVDFLEFQTGFYMSKGMLDDPQKSVDTIRELLRPVALIDDELKRILLLKSLAQKFFLREKLLEDELQVIIDRNLAAEHPQVKSVKPREHGKTLSEEQISSMATKFAPPEKELIKILCEGEPEIIKMIKEEILPDDLMNESAKKILRIIYSALDSGESISLSSIVDKLDDDDLEREITMIAFDSYIVSDRWEELTPSPERNYRLSWAATDTIRRIKILGIDQELQSLKTRIEQTQDDAEVMELMTKIRTELNKKKEIEVKFVPQKPSY
jgi:DNA primase